ncbi:MAG: trypsin-like peptidase domain-containing protein [Lachnospiraceae bacterium]|nr:trypsin-like peptidase domain-containing protein [Lachnospiraceae bacterium]
MTENTNGYTFWAEQIDSSAAPATEPAPEAFSDSMNTDTPNTSAAQEPIAAACPKEPAAPETAPETISESAAGSIAEPTTSSIATPLTDSSTDSAAAYSADALKLPESEPAPISFPDNAAMLSEETAPKKTKKRGHFGRALKKVVGFVASAAVFGGVAAASFLGFTELYYHFNPNARPKLTADTTADTPKDTPSLIRPTISSTNVAEGTNITTTDVSGIVDSAMPSLVSISCTFRSSTSFFGYLYEGTTEGSGSGIIVGSNEKELLIATNNHVIDDALTISVTFADGSSVDATTKGTDSSNDLAIVSVPLDTIEPDTRDVISIATLGSSDDIKVGQMVIAIGNALGYGQTTTVGYISAKEREITVSDSSVGSSTTMTALQVDAAINPGNSGGALLNVNGEVIGINSAKLSDTAVEGIGYAIPISNVLDILTELMNREVLTEEERGYLGVYLSQQDITEDVSAIYGWPVGVYVTETAPDGAGAKYGILAGDIITAINGTKITGYSQLQEKVTSYRSGTTITVTLQRRENGTWTEHELEVVLGGKEDFDK